MPSTKSSSSLQLMALAIALSLLPTAFSKPPKSKKRKDRVAPVTYYTLLSKTSDYALAISMASKADSAVAIEWTSRISHEQQWRLQQVEDHWFQLIARHSGKALVFRDTDHDPVVQGPADRKNHRTHWKVISDSDGFVRFQNRDNKRFLGVSRNKGAHGNGAILSKKEDTDRQKWKLQVAEIDFERIPPFKKLALPASEIIGRSHPEDMDELREFLHDTTWSIRYGSTSGEEEYKMTFDRKGTLTLDHGRVSTLHILGPKTIKLWDYDYAALSDAFNYFQAVDANGKVYYGVLLPMLTTQF